MVLEPQATDTGAMNDRRSILEPQATKKKSSSTIIVVSPSPVVHGSSLQYLSVACGSSICRGSSTCCLVLWLQAPVSPVVHGSTSICRPTCGSIGCRLWLQYLVSVDRSWLQSPVSVVCSWIRFLLYLSFAAPVSPVVSSCGSCGSSSGSSTIYCHFLWLQAVDRRSCGCHGRLPSCGFNRQPSSVLVIFL